MSEGDPLAVPALMLDHIAAGIDVLAKFDLDDRDRAEAEHQAVRLLGLVGR